MEQASSSVLCHNAAQLLLLTRQSAGNGMDRAYRGPDGGPYMSKEMVKSCGPASTFLWLPGHRDLEVLEENEPQTYLVSISKRSNNIL
jgi:hypothetical protein